MSHFEVILAALASIMAVLGSILVVLRWIYRQGISSEKLINSVDKNTDATAKLTVAYEAFSEQTRGTLLDHEKRITRLER